MVLTDEPAGTAIRHVIPRPPEKNEKPLRLFGTSTSRRPSGTRELDACGVDELLCVGVVGDQFDVGLPVRRRLDLDLAGREANLELDRAVHLECLLHVKPPRV